MSLPFSRSVAIGLRHNENSVSPVRRTEAHSRKYNWRDNLVACILQVRRHTGEKYAALVSK